MAWLETEKFIETFASILEEYKSHLKTYSLKVTASTYGDVIVRLFHRSQQSDARDIGTKAPSQLLGQYKTVFPVKDKVNQYELPGVAVIVALFRKIGGPSSEKKEDCDRASQLIARTLYPLWNSVSPPLQQRAAKAMQILLSDRIASVFQDPPISAACQEFCATTVRNCTLFQAGSKLEPSAGNIGPILWGVEPSLGTDGSIARGIDDDSYRLRAIAVALSSFVRAPVCSYLETLFGPSLSHNTTNEVHLDTPWSVVQSVTSQRFGAEQGPPLATIEWQLRMVFDARMSPLSIECIFKSAQGSLVGPDLTAELIGNLNCKWERSLLGTIQALFHRPEIGKTLESIQKQATKFLFFMDHALAEPKKLPLDTANFFRLLCYFRVPDSVLGKVFEPGALEAYLQDQSNTVAPQLTGTLIAVSDLPILEVIPWIVKENGSPAGGMNHNYLRIEISPSPSQIKIIHHLESSLPPREGEPPVLPSSWSLAITLSPRGEPVQIVLQYKGVEVQSSFSNLFAPPLHPVSLSVPPPAASKRCYLPIPKEGLFYNGERIEKYPGEDGFFSILNLFASKGTSQIQGGVEAWNRRLTTGVDPLTRRMRSLIVGFSEIPLFPVLRLLKQITPTASEGKWVAEDVKGDIKIEDNEILIERQVELLCWYNYIDLFRQARSFPQAHVLCTLKFCYDMNGRMKWGTLTRLSSDGVDILQPPPASNPPYNWGSRIFPHGLELENVFQNPPSRADRVQDLSRLVGETLRVFEDDVDILITSDADRAVYDRSTAQPPAEWLEKVEQHKYARIPGLQQLIRRLELPQELLEASRTQETFAAFMGNVAKLLSPWEQLMELLAFPKNKEEFLERLRAQDLEECFVKLDISSAKTPAANDGAGTSASAAVHPSRTMPRSHILERSTTSPTIRAAAVKARRPSESSLSCGTLPRDEGEEQRIKDHQIWTDCVERLGLNEVLKGTGRSDELFFKKWAAYDAEKRKTDFLFLLGLAGGQAVLAPGAILFQKMAQEIHQNLESGWSYFDDERTLGRPFEGIGTTWRQLSGNVDVNIKTGQVATGPTITGYEITRHQRASRINHAQEQLELAFVEWTTTFRFDTDYHLTESSSSVIDIGAPNLTPQMVNEALSFLVSTWVCREGKTRTEGEMKGDTTVCPMISPNTSIAQKKFRSSPQYVVRIPMSHSLAALEVMNGEFLENATTRALNLVNIDPALQLVQEYFAPKKPTTWTGSAWNMAQTLLWTQTPQVDYHVIESSLLFGEEPEAIHTIHTFSYFIERQADMSHMRMVRFPITWKIRIKLQPNGLPCGVETHDLPEDLAKDSNKILESILGITSTFGDMTRSVVAAIKT